MRNKLMLAIAIAVAATTTANSQTILGTHSNDSVLLRANSGSDLTQKNRIKLRSQGQVTFHDVSPTYNDVSYGASTASVAMRRTSSDRIGLLVTDNPSQAIRSAQIAVINSNSSTCENGIYIANNQKFVSTPSSSTNYSIASTGANGGYYRENAATYLNGAHTYYGYRSQNYMADDVSGVSFVSFSSGGRVSSTCESIIDFHAEDLALSGVCNTRYGLKIDFDGNSGGVVTYPGGGWGVFQTAGDIKNHFNGATLFGSTTDNTFDKVQVTGGTKTDGFTAGIRTVTGSSTLTNADYTLLVNASAATITLPTSGIATGKIFTIKKINATAGAVELYTANGATVDEFDDDATPTPNPYTLSTQYSSVTIQFDGTNYHIIAEIVR
jgi:hypothetical protein